MIVNIGINDNNSLHTKLLDIRDNNEILKEVKFTTSLINSQFKFQLLDKAFRDVENCLTAIIRDFKNATLTTMISGTQCWWCWPWRVSFTALICRG
jgi:hypothetical protein